MHQHLFQPIILICIILAFVAAKLPLWSAPAEGPNIVFVVGDHEYSSERTMPLLAKELEERYGFRTTVLRSMPDENSETNIPGLKALESADLVIFYLRWRQLPKDQLKHIENYINSGKPVIGFRTTTHAFNFPAGHESVKWNQFGAEVLGAPWIYHYGHKSSTDVSVIPDASAHPILTGVSPKFHVRSWLYHVRPEYPPKNAQLLLMGKAVDSERKDPVENPVAWTFQTKAGGRVFTTTMGHPEDFGLEPFQRLVENAVLWTLQKPIPQKWKGPMSINVSYEKPPKAPAAK